MALERKHRDPLKEWKFGVPRLKLAFAMFSGYQPIEELHARGPNGTGKTESVCAFVLGCLQKRHFLDNVKLPSWHGRLEGLCCVLDYKQQLLSVQPAYLRLLGNWPHKARYIGEAVSTLYIRPLEWNDDNPESWSVLHFLSQENKRTGVGARADIVHFDEPPVIEILRELRKAGHAWRKSIRIIGETPTIKKQWVPLKDDYGDTPRRSLTRIDKGRAEVRWSLDEVADWVLTPEAKADMHARYAKDPLYGEDGGARIHGDYTSTEGACPFDVETLTAMLGECTEPQINHWPVPRETLDGTVHNATDRIDFEVWHAPKPGRRYYVAIDPSSGVNDGGHNPAALHISEMDSGDLCARWNGYLSPYSVGVLSAGLALQYNKAVIDVETNDHWGATVAKGIWACRYGNLAHETKTLAPGEFSKTVGWRATEASRADIIGAIQRWLEDYRAGIKYANCRSAATIRSILNTELDPRGKIVAIQGYDHGEDMVLRGRTLCRCARRPNMELRQPEAPLKNTDAAIIARIRGAGMEPDPIAPSWKPRVRP